MKRLQDKVVIVSGGAQGIGHAVADRFAEEGALVTAGDIQEPVGPYATDSVVFTDLDVADEDHWKRVVAEVVDRHGRIDVLVNNAGIAVAEDIVDTTTEQWAKVVAVTQSGVFFGMREAIPVMREGGGGSVINFSSIWGVAAVPAAAAYHAAKGAVRMLSKNAAVTYAPDGIRVNSVHPGFVHTPGTDGQDPELTKAVIAATPLGRGAQPVEIANACLFLASEESSFVTGSELVVDGGYLAQ